MGIEAKVLKRKPLTAFTECAILVNMNKKQLVSNARLCESFEELAPLMSWKDTGEHGMDKFVKKVAKLCPDIETIFNVAIISVKEIK